MSTPANISSLTGQSVPSSTPKFLGWTFFILTAVALGYQIATSHKQLMKMASDEVDQQKKIAELEMNLRAIMKNNYVDITPNEEPIEKRAV